VSDKQDDTEIRIRVTPVPSPEIMAAIAAAVRSRRARQVVAVGPEAPMASRWAMAGRREAMMGRSLSSDDPFASP
jgi:hypothetical protein